MAEFSRFQLSKVFQEGENLSEFKEGAKSDLLRHDFEYYNIIGLHPVVPSEPETGYCNYCHTSTNTSSFYCKEESITLAKQNRTFNPEYKN